MNMARWFAVALLSAGMPALAQTGPVDPLTGLPIPLQDFEVVQSFKNGCRVVVPDNESVDYAKTVSWYGACKFGLAEGYGYYQSEYGTDRTFYPATYHFGHMVRSDHYTGSFISLPRGPGRDSSESIDYQDPTVPDPNNIGDLTALTGEDVSRIIADQFLDGNVRRSRFLWMRKESCPTSLYGSSVEKELAKPISDVLLTPAQQHILVPICKAAIARLKAERIIHGNDTTDWPWNPFDKVNYGYYFFLYETNDVAPLVGRDYAASASSVSSGAQLCPVPTTMAGCDVVWNAMEAPYRARRAEIAANWDATMAADAADLERRFAPLEAAFKRKVAARAANGTTGVGSGGVQ